MTRDELIEFLQSNYQPEEQLLWQTISYGDANVHNLATLAKWVKFVERQEYYGGLADRFSEEALNEFFDFVKEEEN